MPAQFAAIKVEQLDRVACLTAWQPRLRKDFDTVMRFRHFPRATA